MLSLVRHPECCIFRPSGTTANRQKLRVGSPQSVNQPRGRRSKHWVARGKVVDDEGPGALTRFESAGHLQPCERLSDRRATHARVLRHVALDGQGLAQVERTGADLGFQQARNLFLALPRDDRRDLV